MEGVGGIHYGPSIATQGELRSALNVAEVTWPPPGNSENERLLGGCSRMKHKPFYSMIFGVRDRSKDLRESRKNHPEAAQRIQEEHATTLQGTDIAANHLWQGCQNLTFHPPQKRPTDQDLKQHKQLYQCKFDQEKRLNSSKNPLTKHTLWCVACPFCRSRKSCICP